jgi:hypothetical protein
VCSVLPSQTTPVSFRKLKYAFLGFSSYSSRDKLL